MKQLKRLTMTLALLIMAVGGAWAQSSLNVVELEVPADWATDDNPVTAGDLPGFKAVSLEEGQNWKGAPTDGTAVLVYAFDGDKVKYINFEDGIYDGDVSRSLPKKTIFGNSTSIKIYYTAEPTEWSLTPDETGKKWTLDKMPASDVELQVEYFAESNLFLSKDALADKTNIAVKAGETTIDFDDNGKSANAVTEGTPMTVTYNGTKKLLGFKAVKKAPAPSLTLTSPEVGQVIGSDGKNYAYGSLPTGVTAVAKICYVSGSNGLALALTDEEGEMDWSTAQTTCAAHTPAFTGGTWKLATKDEWDNMISTAGSDTDLRDGFSSVGGTNMQSGVYWSSTERDSGDSQAWVYFFNFIHDWGFGDKAIDNHVRACLEF